MRLGSSAEIGQHWASMAVSVKGSGKTDAEVCADRSAHWQVCDGRAVVLAVADGAGGASSGAEGAELVITEFESAVQSAPWKSMLESDGRAMRESVEALLRTAIDEARSRLGNSPEVVSRHAATIGVAVAAPESVIVVGLGDIFCCVRSRLAEDEFKLVLAPDRGTARAGRGTYFFTMTDWERHLDSLLIADPTIDAVFLSTDGLEDAALHYGYPDPTAPVRERVARPIEVRLIPDIVRVADKDFDAASLEREVSVPEILMTKGDDIGFALARR
jgi:hypothetical protein